MKIFKTVMLITIFGSLLLTKGLHAEIQQIGIRVDGIACPFCAYGLEKKMTAIVPLKSYDIDLEKGVVMVTFKEDYRFKVNDIKKAVKEAGFTYRFLDVTLTGSAQKASEHTVIINEGEFETVLVQHGQYKKAFKNLITLLNQKKTIAKISTTGTIDEKKSNEQLTLKLISYEINEKTGDESEN